MKSHQICTVLLLPVHWFSRPDINPFPASIACPGLPFTGVALLSGFASIQLVGGSTQASQKMPWGYRVPVWIMPLEEETCTKIWKTAPQKTSQDHHWGVLRPPTSCYPRGMLSPPTPALCPCHPWWWPSPPWGKLCPLRCKSWARALDAWQTDLIFLDNLSSIVWIRLKGREQSLMSTGRERKQSPLLWSNNPAATTVLSGEIRLEGCESHKEVVFSY